MVHTGKTKKEENYLNGWYHDTVWVDGLERSTNVSNYIRNGQTLTDRRTICWDCNEDGWRLRCDKTSQIVTHSYDIIIIIAVAINTLCWEWFGSLDDWCRPTEQAVMHVIVSSTTPVCSTQNINVDDGNFPSISLSIHLSIFIRSVINSDLKCNWTCNRTSASSRLLYLAKICHKNKPQQHSKYAIRAEHQSARM